VRTKSEKEENSSKLGVAAAQHIHLVGKHWFGDSSSVAQERNLTEVGRAPPSAPQPFVMIDHGGAKPSQSLKS